MAVNKNIGGRSAASNDFLEPLTPTGVSASNVGSGRGFNNGAASVSFSLPALSPAATSFTVTATFVSTGSGGDGSTGTTVTQSGASSPIVIGGLKSGASYTFSVTASNAAGTSAASAATSAVTITTVPATPAAPTVTTQVNQDNVSWSTPLNGGSAITSYTWASSDGKGGTIGGTSTPVAQEGSTSQSYTVIANNANGASATSAASITITTTPPFFPPYFVPPFFPPYFVPPYFVPPFFPPYFVPPFFPPYFVPPYFVPPFFPPFFPPSFGGNCNYTCPSGCTACGCFCNRGTCVC
jgi:hypothetical protein